MGTFLFYFLSLVMVYWVTVSSLDAVVDGSCCCLASNRYSIRHRLRALLVVAACLTGLLVLGTW